MRLNTHRRTRHRWGFPAKHLCSAPSILWTAWSKLDKLRTLIHHPMHPIQYLGCILKSIWPRQVTESISAWLGAVLAVSLL